MSPPFSDITDTIFDEKSVLSESYQPEEILEREEEIDAFSHALQDVLFGREPENVCLYRRSRPSASGLDPDAVHSLTLLNSMHSPEQFAHESQATPAHVDLLPIILCARLSEGYTQPRRERDRTAGTVPPSCGLRAQLSRGGRRNHSLVTVSEPAPSKPQTPPLVQPVGLNRKVGTPTDLRPCVHNVCVWVRALACISVRPNA
jgi:hypothetical protein